VCLNISLHDSDVPNVTTNHVVKVTCAVVPDLYDEFILTADVIDHLSRCNVIVSQAQVNDVADSPATVDNSEDVDNDVTVVAKQNDVDCDNVDQECSNVTDGERLGHPLLIVVCRPRPKWPKNSAMTHP